MNKTITKRLRAALQYVCLWSILVASATAAPSLPADFVLQPYATGLAGPVGLAWTADGQTLYVAEKRGRVRVVVNGNVLSQPFIDLRSTTNHYNDRGLLGIALHPNFPATNWVYILYTYDPPETAPLSGNAGRDGAGQRVSRLIRVAADAATNYQTYVPGSEVVLLGSASTFANIGDPNATQTDLSAPWACGPEGAYITDCVPADGGSHSIGTVAFGNDGALYVGNGDAASYSTVDPRALRALHIDSLAGKILRIDPTTGAGLSDNPYWDGNPNTNRSKVWQLGLRNPYRFRLTQNGAVWIGDVGWGAWEELNQGAAGADFGWPCYEGGNNGLLQQAGYAALSECQSYYQSNSAVPAQYAYPHVNGGGAIVAGDVYTATKWPVAYRQKLFFSDYAFSEVYFADISANPVTASPFATDVLAVDIVLGPDDDLYIADVVGGIIYRIAYTGSPQAVSDVAVTNNADDAEEDPFGVVTVTNAELSLGDAGTVGLRFANVDIPRDATVLEAYIQFVSANGDGSAATFTLAAEASDDAAPFSATGFDISSRTLTSQAVGWNPPPWSSAALAGADQQTPDLSQVLEEVVQRPGWFIGNALSFVITGTGSRSVVAYEGGAGLAARLHVVYEVPNNSTPTVTIADPLTGTMFTHGTPVNFSGSALDLEDDDGVLTAALTWSSNIDGVIGMGASFSTTALSLGSHTIIASATDSGGATGTATITLEITPNTPPSVTINAPAPGSTWVVGDTVSFSGSATDAEDGQIAAAALAWEGIIHHAGHQHNDFFSSTGGTGSFSYPDHDTDSYVELCLTATDSGGLTDTACVDLLPLLVNYTFESVPSGLELTYNATISAAPFSVQAEAGGQRQISAPSPQTLQETYHFQSWSIGGAATQQITIAQTPQTLTAVFDAEPHVLITAPSSGTSVAFGDTIEFQGAATDVEDDDATLSNAISWASDLDGNLGMGAALSTATLQIGTHTVTASVIDSAGLSSASSTTIVHVIAVNSPPTVTISTPANGASYVLGETVSFVGSVADEEDDDAQLTNALAWSSDRDGALGTGGAFSLSSLSVGAHVISATVTDSGGVAGNASVAITINDETWTPIARYGTDFQGGSPSSGWLYLWNAGDAIGSESGYAPLLWTGSRYDSDGVGGQDNNENAFGHLRSMGGHPGRGINQGASTDRYVIAGYTVAADGTYRISNSTIAQSSCAGTNGLRLDIFVNDLFVTQVAVPADGSAVNFDADLGVLTAGAMIYVGVGPNAADGCDGFGWDYSIDRAGSGPVNTRPVVSIDAPLSGTSVAQGEAVTFLGAASDVEDDDSALISAMVWSSDLDGTLGNGGSFMTTSLSVGTHTITASVTDSDGAVGQAVTTVTVLAGTWSRIAGYQTDFQEIVPISAWSYMWNAHGQIGVATNYADLLWTGSHYDSDGIPGADSNENAYGDLASGGGHPGRGVVQGAATDRFVIAAYTVASDGTYRVSHSSVTLSSCQWTNGVQVNVYANDTLLRELIVTPNDMSASFDTSMGALSNGDVIYIAVGPNGRDGCDGFEWDFDIERSGDIWTTVAAYRDAFLEGTPATGWHYQWNANGVFGDPAGYANLLWNGSRYDSDGSPGSDANENAYGHFNANGGHPGRGIDQGASTDRYVIAAYTADTNGTYRISSSTIAATSCQWTNGLHVGVYVNDVLVTQVGVPADGTNVAFDVSLGALVAGDTIYVGAGPNGRDGCDGFSWDYQIDHQP